MFLSPDELATLTDRPQPKRQIEWLTRRGWVFEVGASGRPHVTLEFFNERMGVNQRFPAPPEPVYPPLMPDVIRSVHEMNRAKRVPKWRDKEAIKAICAEAKRITLETGIPHHVDHIIPMNGLMVSGLHVDNNLQILTAIANAQKSNRHE